MKKLLLLTFCTFCASLVAQASAPAGALDYCHQQVRRALTLLTPYDTSRQPRNILATDTTAVWNLRPATAEEWCSGFWPGILWMDYMQTGDTIVRKAAEQYTQSLVPITRQPAYDHDLGFIVINSFLKGYQATGRDDYRRAALQAADTLATLFNPRVGTLLSWPRHVKDFRGHNTIMDNMINLELLLWASEHGGSPQLRDIAIAHADTTMRYQFRPDATCYHVAVYDTLSGNFLRVCTHQGYADYSTWARGQAWAIYGYTTMYRYTHLTRFRDFAIRVADAYLRRLHEAGPSYVPIWDFDDPRAASAPRDASAAAVVASALLGLEQAVSHDKHLARRYHRAAINMLQELSSDRYQARERNTAFLLHSTGHHPAQTELDAAIIYADYYYIEALRKTQRKQ